RLLLVLLHVVAVGAAEDLPVDVLELVAPGVLAVLRELDGEPVVRRAVLARDEALDERRRGDVEPRDTVAHVRRERISPEEGHQLLNAGATRGSFVSDPSVGGVASRSLSITRSTLTPSASAVKFVMIRCRSTGLATERMSSAETWNRPWRTARAFPPST